MPSHDKINKTLVFIGVSIGNFIVLLDTSILNVALPTIQREFAADSSVLPWASVAYTIVFAALLLAAGAISDRIGSLRLYRASLLAFALLSIGCAASQTIGALISFRALLGVAAASMIPASLAILAQFYPAAGDRAKAIGMWAAITSSGLLFGPILGGLFTEFVSWRMIFLINPICVAIAYLLVIKLVNSKPTVVRPLDVPGVLLSIVVLGTASFGFIRGGTEGWSDSYAIASVVMSLLSLFAMLAVEKRSQHPVLPPQMFANRDLSVAALAACVATMVFYGMLYSLTIWYQKQHGLSPSVAGLAFVPMTLPMCFLPIFTGRMVASIGARRVIIFGLLFDVLAGAMLIGVGYSETWLLWVILAEVALVLASTTVIPAGTAQVSISAPAEYAASAQGALNAGRQAGSALGVAILGPLTSMESIGGILASISLLTLISVLLMRTRSGDQAAPQTT